jgi:hypothetical protein
MAVMHCVGVDVACSACNHHLPLSPPVEVKSTFRAFSFRVHSAVWSLRVPSRFSSAVVPEAWRFWYSLNPVVGVIDGFRWCLLGGESQLYMPGFLLSLGVTGFFLWVGPLPTYRAQFRGSDPIR